MFNLTDTYTATLIDEDMDTGVVEYAESGIRKIVITASLGDVIREALDAACDTKSWLTSIEDSTGNVVYENGDEQFAEFEDWDCDAPVREISATEAFDIEGNWTIDTDDGSYKLYGTLGWVVGILIDEERKVNAIIGVRYRFTGTEEEIDAWKEWVA